jgi:hypothetical protein
MSTRSRKWEQKNPEKVREYRRRSMAKIRAEGRAWEQKNPDKVRKYKQRWVTQHAAQVAEAKSLFKARERCERLGLPDPLPRGYDRRKLLPIFEEATRRRAAGESVHVDHRRCLAFLGTHVASNLQVLTVEQHIKKTTLENVVFNAIRRSAPTERSA